jgi:hypothetical protein
MKSLALALPLALVLAGFAASTARAEASGTTEITCSQVVWSFTGFPNAENNTVTEKVTVNGTTQSTTIFKFNGPSGSNTVAVTAPAGNVKIDALAHWNTNGVTGLFDHIRQLTCPAPPPAAPLTPGYWKNHLSTGSPNTKQHLPQSIGNYEVDTTEKAAAIFKAMRCSNASSSSQNAIGCLAGQLLATELNLANGSNACIAAVVSKANSWLMGNTQDGVPGVVYAGPSVSYTITQAQRNEAIALKDPLATYNTGGGC